MTMNPIEGKTLPEWAIKPIAHHPAPSLLSFRGAPLLILFFNLGCAASRSRAIPRSIRYSESYPYLRLVGIHTNLNDVDYLPGQIASFLYKTEVPYPVFQDQDKKTSERYGVDATPHWLLISSEGLLLKSIFGAMSPATDRLDYSLTELFHKEAI